MLDRIKACFTESIQTQIAAAEALPDAISRAAMTLVQSLLNGNKILCCGNGTSAASVTPQKQQRLLKAARLWLSRQNGSFDTVDCRFDVVAFTGNDIQWLKNAFGE